MTTMDDMPLGGLAPELRRLAHELERQRKRLDLLEANAEVLREKDLAEVQDALIEIVVNARLAPPGDVFAQEVLRSKGAAICERWRL